MSLPRRPAAAGLVLSLSLALSPGRDVAAQAAPRAFERIDQEKGLSNGSVTAIVQGRFGFLTVGTQDGLNIYDGMSFVVYRPVPGDTTSLADGWITALAVSRGGPPWIGTLQGGVHRMVPPGDGFRRLRHRPGDSTSLASDNVNTLLEGSDGTLWVGTVAGLSAVDTASGRARHYRPDASGDSAQLRNDVISIAELPGRQLWVGTRLGVYQLDQASGRFQPVSVTLRTREIRALLPDARGRVWIGTPDDLVAVDTRTLAVMRRYSRTANSPVAYGVNALARGSGDTIWIATDRGLVALDGASGAFARDEPRVGDPHALPGPIARAVYVDRGGVLWAGLESHGLAKHAPSAVRFTLVRGGAPAGRSLSDGYVRGMAQDPHRNVWVGTQHGGLNRIDARTGRITSFRHRAGDPQSLPGDNVWAILFDRAGTMWVGLHTRGLGTFDARTGRFTRAPLVPADASVNVLYEDRAGRLYVGTEGRGLYVASPDRRTVTSYGATVGAQRVLMNNDVQSVLEDSRGRLWVGGADGLSRRDGEALEWRHFRGMSGPGTLSSNFVTNVVEDRRGRIWVATKGGGLHRFEERTGTFTAFGPAQGLPHSFIYGVLEDAGGRLWLSSDDGIAMFDPDQRLVTRYGLADGLQAREFNRRAHLRASDGTMYFGGINGLNVFDPDVVAALPAPPTVALARVHMRSGVVRSAARLTVDSTIVIRDASPVTIAFAALDYTAPEKIQFAYRLEGIDDDWVMSGARREATYASLPPGRHVFRVIAASPSGAWNRQGAGVTLVVLPPWWATWWARAGQALLLGGIVFGVVRLRVGAVRRRSVLLKRLVGDRTRDLTEAQARLRESLARERRAAQALLDMTAAVPGAVFQMVENADGRRSFRFVSRGISDLLHGSETHLHGADPAASAELLLARLEPDDRRKLEQHLSESRESLQGWRTELRWVPTDGGEVRWLSIQAHVARADGSIVWTGLMTDTTDARRAEAERLALESRMLQTQKSESLAVLAGGVAHDFNNVLVSVLVGAELLEVQVGDNPRALSTVRRIRSAGQRAAELTQQILAYAGKARPGTQRLDVAALAREMVPLVRATVPKSASLEVQQGVVPAIVEADATQLRQVVMNLITNAGEAIGPRPGAITVRVDVETRVRRELHLLHAAPDMPASGPYVVLEVADDGCGMEPALLQRIFDPFFTTKFTGRGLGLAALLGIVRAHRGGVNVVTAPGSGTRFCIYLPLAHGVPDAAPARVSGEHLAAGRPTRILVVDDEDDVRAITRSVLERFGYEVVLAEDGEAAVAVSGASNGIDVFLIDVMMPGMNGPATARALRSRGYTAPIILMSGYAEEDLLTRGLTLDADAFLRKPFEAAQLAALVKDVLRARPAPR